jgi:hypothetical protein
MYRFGCSPVLLQYFMPMALSPRASSARLHASSSRPVRLYLIPEKDDSISTGLEEEAGGGLCSEEEDEEGRSTGAVCARAAPALVVTMSSPIESFEKSSTDMEVYRLALVHCLDGINRPIYQPFLRRSLDDPRV